MTFLSNETGAVTVDWVVLTAALVGLGLATMGVVSNGVEDLSRDVDTQLQDDTIISTGFRTASNIAYGFVGAKVWQDPSVMSGNYDSFSAYSDADLLAEYQTSASTVQGIVDNEDGGWGPGGSANYHRMVVQARILQDREIDLPEGSITAAYAYPTIIERRPDLLESSYLADSAG